MTLAPSSKATPAQDQALYDIMLRAGVALYPKAVGAAYAVCNEVWSGVGPDYVASEVMGLNPAWSLSQSQAFVAAAIWVYCPPAQTASAKASWAA